MSIADVWQGRTGSHAPLDSGSGVRGRYKDVALGFQTTWFRALAAVLAMTRLVLAEPTANEKETARALMAEGRSLREQKDELGALKRFQTADAIMHVPTTGLEVARSQMALGQLVEARDTLHRIMQTPDVTDSPPFRQAREAAASLDQALQTRIGALRFDVRGLRDRTALSLLVDGRPIPLALVDVPFRVNPGPHTVVADGGSGPVREVVSPREGETIAVVIDSLSVDRSFAGGWRTGLAPGIAGSAAESPAGAAGFGMPALAYAGFAVGGAGVLAAGVTARSRSVEQEFCG